MSESFDEFQPAPNEWDEFQPANPGPSTRDVLKAVSSIDPAQASKASKLAKKYNAADEVLLRTLQDAEMVDRVNTATTKLDKAPVLADYMRNSPFVAAQAQKDIDPLVKMGEQMRAPRTALGTLGDIGVTALKGVVGLPQSLVGLVDIPTLGGFGKDLETLGVRFKDTQNFLSSLYSPAQQQANQVVSEADGFVGTLGAMLQNPSTIATTVGQSAPQMLGGAAIGRGLVAVAPRVAPWLSAALGEGIISAGGAAEQTREQTDDGRLTVKQSLSAVASGGGTALFGAVGGKVAQRLGLADIDTALVARGVDKTSAQAAKTGFISAITKAGVSEGVFEELPQSVQEQMWQNYANDRPINEGVGAAAAQGLLAGLSMGSGFQVLAEGGQRIAARAQQADAAAQDAAKLQNLMTSAAEATLRQNNPETFAQLVQHMADNTEGAPKSVYIDAQVFNQAVQTLTPEQLAQAFPSVTPEQIAEAVTTNSTVEVPIGEALAAVPGTPLEQVFLQNARSAPDALSLADAQTQGEQAAEWIKTEAERVLQQAQDQTAWQTSSEGVRATILDQLNQAGRFTPEVNEAYALLQSNFFSTMAARTGVTPQELYDRFSLKVAAGAQQAAGGTLEQGLGLFDLTVPEDGNALREIKTDGTTIVLNAKGRYFNPEGVIEIASVRTPAKARGNGKARRALETLVKQADAEGVTLKLDASPLDKKTNLGKLVAFYESLGFERTGRSNNAAGEPEMIRRPAQALNQTAISLPPTIEINGKQRPTTNSNGQPIAATEEGVRNFWAWFGDSKVVDAEGKPLVVYHGTASTEITEFLPRDESGGTNTTRSRTLAEWFRKQKTSNARIGYMRFRSGTFFSPDPDYAGNYTSETGGVMYPAYVKTDNPVYIDQRGGAVSGVDPSKTIDALVMRDGEKINEVAVLDPTQIKSAIGNDGTFDPANPNILRQQARGTFNPQSLLITLNENANLSTFLHESGHFFLEVMADLAAQPDAPAQVREDMDKLLAWFGIKGDENVGGQDAGGSSELAQGSDAPYHRFTNGTADTGVGYMMFADDAERVRGYGRNHYTFDPADMPADAVVSAGSDEFKAAVAAALENNQDKLDEYQATAEALASETNPDDIVNSAGFWDAPDLVEIIWNEVLEPNGWLAVETQDGVIVFDPDAVRQAQDADEYGQDGPTTAAIAPPIQPLRTPLETWRAMTLDQKRQYHERFAESFEQYLLEGKAPSAELQPLFRRFRSWLVNVYKSLKEFMRGRDLNMNDEVRQVFDRMLATDEQIRQAEEAAGMLPDFDATNEAIEKLQARSLRDLKWTIGARSRALKALQKEAANLRKAVEAEVRAEVDDMPVYQAQAAIDRIKGEPSTEQLETIAEATGFTSASEMLTAIGKADTKAAMIEGMTDQRMLENFGELATPQAIEEAANDAVHNEARARALATELKAQADALNPRQQTGTDRNGRPVTVNALVAAAKQFAENITARRKVKDLKKAAAQHRAAEARAGKAWQEATAKGKTQEAVQAKRDQMLNNYAAKSMQEADAEITKVIDYFKKFDKDTIRKNIPSSYLDQIDALLENMDLRKSVSRTELERRASLRKWVESQQAIGLDPIVPDELMENAQRISYKEMTVDELRAMRDVIKNIEHLGRLKSKLLAAKDKREFDAAVDAWAKEIRDNGGKPLPVKLEGDSRPVKMFKSAWADHRKLNSLIRQFAANADNSEGFKLLIRSMNERGTQEDVMIEKASVRLAEIHAPIEKLPGGFSGAKLFIPEINNSLTRAGRLAVALNWGNEQNRQRVRDGDNWTNEQVDAILRTLSPVELKFVNDVWAYLDSYWPEIKAKQERVSGVVEDKVEADPFTVTLADGTEVQMRGGYYPIKYDGDRSLKSQKQEAEQIAKDMLRGAMLRPATRRGHTKARVDEVIGRPVKKDLSVITQHVTQVVHDLAWHEWAIDANRLMNDPRIASAIRDYYGAETHRAMTDAIEAIVVGDVAKQTSIDQLLLMMRANVTRSIMGASLTTALLQPFGLTQSMARIGVTPVLKGAGRWAGDALRMESTVKWVGEKSDFMRLRSKTFNRELREISQRVRGKSKIAQVADASLFMLMQKMQLVADIPTWVGAYEKALNSGAEEATAVQLADEAVLSSQGGGNTRDLAAVQRDHPFLTQFYSYFNTTLQLVTESTAATDFKNPRAVAGWLGDMMLLAVVPAILPALITFSLKGGGEDDEPEEWAKRLVEWQAGYMLGMFVGLRELPALWSPFDYGGPPAAKLINDGRRLVQQANQGEIDEPAVLATIGFLGTALGIPTTQIVRSYKGWKAWDEGDAPASSILFGPPPKD